jgi:hypothetical protein
VRKRNARFRPDSAEGSSNNAGKSRCSFVTCFSDSAQAIFDILEFVALDLRFLADLLVNELEETGNDRKRPVDVVDDARVNLATRERTIASSSFWFCNSL